MARIYKFSSEELEILRANPYTEFVSDNVIRFTDKFKEVFWARYAGGELPRAIFKDLGYDEKIINVRRIENFTRILKQKILNPAPVMQRNKFKESEILNADDYANMTQEQAVYAMQLELIYLRQEVDFLKKITELSSGTAGKE